MESKFKKAERKQVKLKLALTGPSGSGKTYSALRLAKGLVDAGLGKRIAVIDTENDSASLYAGDFDFDSVCIEQPYTIAKYRQAFMDAKKEGFDIVICDSITHAWAGEGGLLSKKESLDASGKGNSYTNWASITKEHEAFKAAILLSDFHLICTMRSKQDYVLESNDKGKQAPKKVGMAPIQRDGMEYEFTTVFDISMSHECSTSKDRTNLFDGQIFKITEESGAKLAAWLLSAKPVLAPSTQTQDGKPPVAAKAAPQPFKPQIVSDPGKYKVSSGKYVGKLLEELTQDQLVESVMSIEKWATENNKNLDEFPAVKEFVHYSKLYLTQGDAAEPAEPGSFNSFPAY